ncbi:MAG: transglutaminase-like domain-containing protein [Beutenbergiaceae bacterium]
MSGLAPTRSAAGRRSHRPGRLWWTPERVGAIVVPAMLVAMVLAPLYEVYLTPAMWLAVAGGVIVGTALATIAAQRRWPTLTVLAFALPLFFLLGVLAAPETAIGGVLPSVTTWQLMGQGMVTMWKQVLTIAPPLGTTGALLLLPYFLSYFGCLIAVTISLRARRWSLSLLVPVTVGVTAILFSTRFPVAPGVLGVLVVALAISWVAWRAGRLELHRVIAIPLALGLVAIGGTGAALLAAPSDPRFVLRDLIEPPPDPHDYPSPLAGMRRYVDTLAEETVFTVSGLPAQTELIRLATMDSYDGYVWGISASGAPGSGTFARPGERLVTEIASDAVAVEVAVEEYRGVWLPTLGASQDIDFTGSRSDELTDGFYFNDATDTGLVAAGLRGGDGYRLLAAPEPILATDDEDEAPDTSMLAQPAMDIAMPEPAAVPAIVSSKATEYSAGAVGDFERVYMIATALRSYGYFSHGLEGEPPSRPGHGASRLVSMLDGDQITGDAEQYAAAMALMVRALGLPARVVMGFEVPEHGSGSVAITGADVTAWVEVPFEGMGWLAFFPTPDEDQVPQVENPQPQDRPEPQVLQPPEPPQEPPVVPPLDRGTAPTEQDPPEEDDTVKRILFFVAAIGIPLLVLVAPLIIVVVMKALRWRRRRARGGTSTRLAGGWDELSDRVLDLGVDSATGATRVEAGRTFDSALTGTGAVALAIRADAGVFAPEQPTEQQVMAYWSDIHTAVRGAGQQVGLRRRFRARFSLRSLRRPRPEKMAS